MTSYELNSQKFQMLEVDEREDRVTVTLNRLEARNAIDAQMVKELHEVCAYLEVTPKILIVMGKPGTPAVFASGADISELRNRRRVEGLRGINAYLFERISRLPMPVIAALDGFVLGGGAELAFAADLRIGTSEVRLGNPEANLGIMAAAGATWRLGSIVGQPLAKEILLAGRVLNGEECLEAGAITALAPRESLLEEAHLLADRVAALDPTAVRVTKTVLRMPTSAHPDVDTIAQALLFESEQKFERMDEFLNRRKK